MLKLSFFVVAATLATLYADDRVAYPISLPIAPLCMKKNEVLSDCPLVCPERSCANQNLHIMCLIRVVCGKKNKLRCACRSGYIRDENEDCVLPENCPTVPQNQTCGENAEWKECRTGCSNPLCKDRKDPLVCTLICDTSTAGCACKTNYFYENGKCIPENQCPPIQVTHQCGANAEWRDCLTSCSSPRCADIKNPIFCAQVCQPKGGCACKSKYYLNSSNVCVPENECS